MIEIKHLGGEEWNVTVRSGRTTEHRVRVSGADVQRFAGENGSVERLLEESFRFLLERESNTSILSSFELPVIGRYFPEYETEIRRRIGI
jgi:hypothetical protein